mmetsp:Transcript_29423/g.47519  ORF Transcript_29423/g.47519 Transcript_29423/m.47519 type:complete len:371 (-) Transcript_29423:688-1800(-)|eukprot:CAMPEP_0184650724 /NCGR_PEP_ID=MMETSP0308-20130426/8300_1 /TAXON_ID=38269 /ORGANISM="Gloeochaete witrockiana, Strain SAG 46.84" /LENGTH=370 /DNA_ID=CAMNT_0027084483 /DNA_START=1893 /DNA_END=3005 /DNA_ORIENTATION=+
MAKIGEGDPRWIVKERADGQNVNNWHWVERDCTAWAKSRITELLAEKSIVAEKDITVDTAKVDAITGEANANNRKGKRIVFYELNLKLKWTGELFDSEGKSVCKADGTAEVTNLSEEQSADDLDVIVSVTGTTTGHQRLREAMRTKGISFIRKKLGQFIDEFVKGEGDSALQRRLTPSPPVSLPTDPSAAAAAAKRSPVPMSMSSSAPPLSQAVKVPAATADGVVLRTITQKVQFTAPPSEIFECLLDSNRVSAYTQGHAEISRQVGGNISLFGGSVTGTIVELVPHKKIVQKWRFNDWAEGLYSTVTIDLEPSPSDPALCNLSLVQTGVPETDARGHGGVVDRTAQGWRMHFWEKIKLVFNYGMTTIPH